MHRFWGVSICSWIPACIVKKTSLDTISACSRLIAVIFGALLRHPSAFLSFCCRSATNPLPSYPNTLAGPTAQSEDKSGTVARLQVKRFAWVLSLQALMLIIRQLLLGCPNTCSYEMLYTSCKAYRANMSTFPQLTVQTSRLDSSS